MCLSPPLLPNNESRRSRRALAANRGHPIEYRTEFGSCNRRTPLDTDSQPLPGAKLGAQRYGANDHGAAARRPLEHGLVRFLTRPLVGFAADDSAHRRISSASIYDPA